jgi:hypothetical protein
MQTTTQTAIAESIKSIEQSVVPSIAIHISFEMLLATIETLPHHQQRILFFCSKNYERKIFIQLTKVSLLESWGGS